MCGSLRVDGRGLLKFWRQFLQKLAELHLLERRGRLGHELANALCY